MDTVYLDTSVISAFNEDREPEKIIQTREFFKKAGPEVEIYVSSLVKH